MIDPKRLIKPTDAYWQKQEFLLFCILSVGKNSDVAAAKLELLLSGKDRWQTPFEYLLGQNIPELIIRAKTGQYQRVAAAISKAISLDVETVTLDELLAIHGIGPKTARFFLVHAQGKEYAVLDTHILRWMRSIFPDSPKATPTAQTYGKWEKLCLMMMRAEFPNHTALTADLMIWLSESGREVAA